MSRVPWIDDEQVRRALEARDHSALNASGCRYCISSDWKACVVIRRHIAWHIKGEGWRDSNAPPTGNETGRDLLNFFALPHGKDPGIWFKCFLPSKLQATDLRTEGDCYVLEAETSVFRAPFAGLRRVMWDLMTGHAICEADIASAFKAIWREP
jgi:hypothetical protein